MKTCEYCKQSFLPKQPQQRFCSRTCAGKAAVAMQKPKRNGAVVACIVCGTGVYQALAQLKSRQGQVRCEEHKRKYVSRPVPAVPDHVEPPRNDTYAVELPWHDIYVGPRLVAQGKWELVEVGGFYRPLPPSRWLSALLARGADAVACDPALPPAADQR